MAGDQDDRCQKCMIVQELKKARENNILFHKYYSDMVMSSLRERKSVKKYRDLSRRGLKSMRKERGCVALFDQYDKCSWLVKGYFLVKIFFQLKKIFLEESKR